MVPTPTVLSAQMRPPDKPTVDLQIPGPRPAASLAVSDACQARSTSAAAITLPQASTASTTVLGRDRRVARELAREIGRDATVVIGRAEDGQRAAENLVR